MRAASVFYGVIYLTNKKLANPELAAEAMRSQDASILFHVRIIAQSEDVCQFHTGLAAVCMPHPRTGKCPVGSIGRQLALVSARAFQDLPEGAVLLDLGSMMFHPTTSYPAGGHWGLR